MSYLDSLTDCCVDQFWSVRDVACVASSAVIKHHINICHDKLHYFITKYLNNISDPIASLRQGGAMSLANLASTSQENIHKTIFDKLSENMKNIRHQQNTTEDTRQLVHESNLATVGDINKGDIGGCSESVGVNVPSEPWHGAEGAVLTVAEICRLKVCTVQCAQLLPIIFESCHYRQYDAHLTYCTSVVNALTAIFKSMDKKYFKPYLEFDVIFICMESNHIPAKRASQDCLAVLSKVLGPNILRGRVENFNPNYVKYLDSLAPPSLGQFGSITIPVGHVPSPVMSIPGRPGHNFSLGGTPPE